MTEHEKTKQKRGSEVSNEPPAVVIGKWPKYEEFVQKSQSVNSS